MREDLIIPGYQPKSYESMFTAQTVGGCVRLDYHGKVPDSATFGLSNYVGMGRWITRKLGHLNFAEDVGVSVAREGKTQEEILADKLERRKMDMEGRTS